MLRKLSITLAGVALVSWGLSARAQENNEQRALVLKAMEAHGGKKVLAKYMGVTAKYKGTMNFMGAEAKMSGEVALLFPFKMKNDVTVEVNNMNIAVKSVFDGTGLYVNAGGNAIELKDAKLVEETKEDMYVEKVAGLADLDDAAYKFAALGESKVQGKDTIGIRVSREGRRDVNLYFDKQSHLLAKYEYRGREPFQMMEVTIDKLVSDYKDIQGLKTATKVLVQWDGKDGMNMEVSDLMYHERLDDSVFARP
jgi:hypothetical protein